MPAPPPITTTVCLVSSGWRRLVAVVMLPPESGCRPRVQDRQGAAVASWRRCEPGAAVPPSQTNGPMTMTAAAQGAAMTIIAGW
jgi:hypothetical protein